MKALNKEFVRKTFPLEHVQFMFSMQHIDRYKYYYKNRFKNPYEEDLVISVTDVKKFHQDNFLMNKKHYPATSKLFKAKLVTFFQHYGAKVHFNYIPMLDEQTQRKSYLRYLIIEHSDLIRDLYFWETLSVANLMLRPINVLHNEDWFVKDAQMQEALLQNRVSALSLALLTSSKSNQEETLLSEKTLYTTLLNRTKYQSKGFRLIDYEDTDLVVHKQLENYQEIYRPILQKEEPFNSCIQMQDFEGEKAILFRENQECDQKFMMNINDNVLRNMGYKISTRTYDPQFKYTKRELSDSAQEKAVSQFLGQSRIKGREWMQRSLQRSLEKIMIAHRNTKLFLLMMSGPFMALMLFIKYTLKILILYLLYKHKGKHEKESVKVETV